MASKDVHNLSSTNEAVLQTEDILQENKPLNVADRETADGDEQKKWEMGHFIMTTPCVRSSLLFGITSGMTIGMAMFVYSKHVKRSCDMAVGAFSVSSLGSWSYCSHKRHRQLKNTQLVIDGLERRSKALSKTKETT